MYSPSDGSSACDKGRSSLRPRNTTHQLCGCIYSFHVRCSAKSLRPLKWGWDGFMMTTGGWTHMLSLFCSDLGGTLKWQHIPLGSLVDYNAHTLASLVMVRWKRKSSYGEDLQIPGQTMDMMNEHCDQYSIWKEGVNYQSGSWSRRGACRVCWCSTDRLTVWSTAFWKLYWPCMCNLSISKKHTLYNLCASDRNRGTCLLGPSVTLWDLKDPCLRYWWTKGFAR